MSGWDADYRYEPQPLFEHTFRCRSFDQYGRPELEAGNRIIMPLSSFSLINSLPVRFPLFFKMEGFNSDKISHCGVLEFTAEEGVVLMPRWMMKNLSLEDDDDVILQDASLFAGYHMKLRPHATAFTEVSNLKAVLETALRGYACLSRGDTIMVRYNKRDYYIDVLEVNRDGEAVSLIETDCVLELAPPLDYVEPSRDMEIEGAKELRSLAEVAKPGGGSAVFGGLTRAAGAEEAKKGEKDGGKDEGFKAFTGRGRTLGGGWSDGAVESGGRSAVVSDPWRAAAAEGSKIERDGGKDEEKEKFKAFSGRSRVLGGPSLDAAAAGSDGWSSAVARGPSRAAVVEEGIKREKDDSKVAFKAFSGRGRVIGEPLFD